MMDKMDEPQEKSEIEDVVPKKVLVGNMNTSNTLLAVIAVLVIMSGVQVFQTQRLLSAVASGSIKASAQGQNNNKVNLPSQVGGCG